MGRKSRQKQKRKCKNPSQLARPMQLPPGLGNAKVIWGAPPGGRKMSEVLMEFIEPFGLEWTTLDELKKTVAIAALAWNAGFMSKKERSQCVQDITEPLPQDLRPGFAALFERMIDWKLTRYASNTRMILNFDVSMTPEGPHLDVISSLE